MKNQMIIIAFLVSMIMAGAGFFGGIQYQKMQKPTNPTGINGARRFGNQNANGTSVRGQILASDDKTITIKLSDGSSKIVVVGANTPIMEATSTSKMSLVIGKSVMIIGINNSDGSITANNIQLNPKAGQNNQ